jgi:two-component system response regulator HydG
MANVLLIDDMVGVRKAVAMLIKTAGHKVTEAGDGAEGIQRLKLETFDLVITDIMMPNVDGLEVINFIHTLPKRPPILAISGGGASLPADQALLLAKTKADMVLNKPFDNAQFLGVIKTLLDNGGK